MKKMLLLRALMGFPIGITIGYAITLFVSLAIGDGGYHAVSGLLAAEFGNEINAIIFQAVLSGILGSCIAAASIIWNVENWGFVKQTGLYFLALAAAILPIAYFTHWMERTLAGFAVYFAIFVGIFLFNWVIQLLVWRWRIKRMNGKIAGRARNDM